MTNKQDTFQKAVELNMDKDTYGTLAEIGAGQETSRWFFKVGGAAGTIAKTMSAYDMKVSDSIYGDAKRYVSRERLNSMLSREYDLLIERLQDQRGENCTFFSFANTVTTYSFTTRRPGHGWLGIRFQANPREEPSQIDVHVSLKGDSAAEDQDTLGVLGVNLIHAACFKVGDVEALLDSLMDSLSTNHLELDMIDFLGPAFEGVDNRLMALHLVKRGYTSAAMFRSDGKLVQPADVLYKRSVLVERSRFRPPTRLNMNMLDKALTALCDDKIACEDVVVISEMTLENLMAGDDISTEDFLERVDVLCSLGKNVMVSNFGEFYRLAQYLFKLTSRPVAITMGVPTLRKIFEEKFYEHLDGGILEAIGRMFRNDMRLYVCPEIGPDGRLITVNELEVDAHLTHLYQHLMLNGYIHSLDSIEYRDLEIQADKVLQSIREGDESWKEHVPPEVVALINDRGMFRAGT